jgi:hypothetical protein
MQSNSHVRDFFDNNLMTWQNPGDSSQRTPSPSTTKCVMQCHPILLICICWCCRAGRLWVEHTNPAYNPG